MATTQPPNPHQLRRLAPDLSPASYRHRVDDLGSQVRLKPECHVNHRNRQRKSHRRRALRTEDDRELAADRNFALPSDRPRLERQEAFRVPSTQRYSDSSHDDHDLYRLGLLYDDEHLRGSGFNLDFIIHPEPVYSVRPAKRTRKDRGGDVFATRQNAPLEVIYESQESSLPSPPMTPVATSLPDLVWNDSEDGFTLLDDEVSDDGEEYGTDDVSSVTGDPWIMLGDGS